MFEKTMGKNLPNLEKNICLHIKSSKPQQTPQTGLNQRELQLDTSYSNCQSWKSQVTITDNSPEV